jgi:hypothetical protein
MDPGIDIGFKEHQADQTSLVCAKILKITFDLGIQIFGKCLVAAQDGTDEKPRHGRTTTQRTTWP